MGRTNAPGAGSTAVLPAPADRAESPTPNPDPVIAMLEEWLADESGYDEEAWPALKEALDRERELVGAPKLFGD